MTLHDDLTRTAALLRAGWPIANLARAKRAQEQADMTRDNPIAEPRDVRPRPRRQCIPVLHVEAAHDPVTDESAEFCAVADVPTCARAVGVEAYRRQVDAMALDPAHGIAQADGIRDARRRRAGVVAAQAVKDLDGAAPPMIVATLILEALERDGVL